MPYQLNQRDIFALAASLRSETRQKGEELFFKYCPYCGGGLRRDKNTFSVNLETGAFHCFRAGCGRQGHFVEMARDFGFALDFEQAPRKQFRKLPQRPVQVREEAVRYLASRGIGEEIARRYRVTAKRDQPGVLVFPFFDENGMLQFVKYRNTAFVKGNGSKEWCERGTKPIFYGMDLCAPGKPLVITEGQIDSLSVAQCGIPNAVSVPTGAKGFQFLDNVWEWLCSFPEVIVFGDLENGSMSLLKEFTAKLPPGVKVRAVREEDYLGEKDANDLLRRYGEDAVRRAVERAEVQMVSGVVRLADVEAVDPANLPRILTGVRELDRILGGMYGGQVILLTGRRGEGKSTFLSQLFVEAIDQGAAAFAYSGELSGCHFKRWVDLQCAGPDNLREGKNEFGDPAYSIPEDILRRIEDWYRDKAFLYDNAALPGEDGELNSLLETVERAVCRYDVKLICIDNLMTAMDAGPGDNLYQAQSAFVRRLKELAVKHSAVVLLVAHPKKTREALGNDDVSGSSDITNRVDVVLSYSRSGEGAGCDSLLSVLKNRLTGRITRSGEEIELYYSVKSKRVASLAGGKRVYGWEREQNKELLDLDGYVEV